METNTTIKYFLTGFVTLLIGAGVGMYAVTYLSSGKEAAAYQNGFNAAKAIVQNSSLGGYLIGPEDVRSLPGTITAVQSDGITLHLSSVSPFDDQILQDRTVIISPNTAIISLGLKPGNQEDITSGQPITSSATMQSPYPETKVDIANVQVGDTVMVFSDTNVKSLKSFEAAKIYIQPRSITASTTP